MNFKYIFQLLVFLINIQRWLPIGRLPVTLKGL